MDRQRLVLLLLSIFCLGYGIFTKEPNRVMRKAIMICLECIGIG